MEAMAGRCRALMDRVLELEAQLAAARAVQVLLEVPAQVEKQSGATDAPQPEGIPAQSEDGLAAEEVGATCAAEVATPLIAAGPTVEEMEQRLALVAPAMRAELGGPTVGALKTRRRNAAAHCRKASAARIRTLDGAGLNRLQRSERQGRSRGRRAGRARKHRGAPESRTAAEAVPLGWCRQVRSGKAGATSAPCRRGAVFDMAERSRYGAAQAPREQVDRPQ